MSDKKLRSKIRDRLYNNINPNWSYDNPIKVAYSAIIKNKPYYGEEKMQDDPDSQALGLYEEYLNIPEEKRRSIYRLQNSNYQPAKSVDKSIVYKKLNLSENDKLNLARIGLLLNNGESKTYQEINQQSLYSDPSYNIPNTQGLGNFTISRGSDENGEYISYYDKYDINPFAGGLNKRPTKLSNLIGLNKKEDLTFGIGTPFEIYDRIYLKDINIPENKSLEEQSKIKTKEDIIKEAIDSGAFTNEEILKYFKLSSGGSIHNTFVKGVSVIDTNQDAYKHVKKRLQKRKGGTN